MKRALVMIANKTYTNGANQKPNSATKYGCAARMDSINNKGIQWHFIECPRTYYTRSENIVAQIKASEEERCLSLCFYWI